MKLKAYPATRASGVTLLLAHGAGADQFHPFMVARAEALASRGIAVVTFNFAYMDAKSRRPDPPARLLARFAEAIGEVRGTLAANARLAIGGKSMGGRMATMLAADAPEGLAGVVALGYPLHPPKQPAKLRVAHLAKLRVPLLVVQGERDAFGTPEELAPHLALVVPPPRVHVVAGGDHSFAVAKKRGDAQALLGEADDVVAAWLRAL